ncbi:MAG: 50S ribosomal protein L2 [Candidatus Micrarchaeota archaeon]|nr:50S ribosomal protein L2 [Candidatus Micrarchaeota archaeon]
MGKRLITQQRGRGTPRYRAPSHRYKYTVKFRQFDAKERRSKLVGEVVGFVRDPIHSAVLMRVLFDNGEEHVYFAPEGIKVGDRIEEGATATLALGSVIPLGKIPEGSPIFNIERRPGDGGKLVRTSGGIAYIRAKEAEGVYVRMPSKRTILLGNDCRAQLGCLSMGGRMELPLMKAGTAYYKKHATNRHWPIVRGVHQNAVDHPFGGKQHHPGKGTATAKNAPPGRKVGHIAARSTGRRTSLKMQLKGKKEEGKG